MSIIPASRLSASDLARLGNNFTDCSQRSPHRPHPAGLPHSPHQRRRRNFLAAVNRSLATVGEQVSRLHSTSDYSAPGAAVVA